MNEREAFEAEYSKGDFGIAGCDLSKHADGSYINDDAFSAFFWFKAGLARANVNEQSQAQQNHIGDSNKLVKAVNALAAQTGESPESITEWLTDKGGLTQLMLSHFGGMSSQAQQESRLIYMWRQKHKENDNPWIEGSERLHSWMSKDKKYDTWILQEPLPLAPEGEKP